MVGSLTIQPEGPSTGPATTTNTFGNLTFDPSPMMGSTSAPSSLRGPAEGSSSGSSSGLNSSSGGNSIIQRPPSQQPPQLMQTEGDKSGSGSRSGSGSDSVSDSGSDCGCQDENCDCDDASWIELSADIPSIDGTKITEKIDNMLTSISKMDASTSVGHSLNPDLVDLEQQLITLKEDNIRLLSVLEATNEAMKKNLSYAQELKGDLKMSHDEYDSLKSSADTAIDQLRADNERLRQKVNELETELQERNSGPVAYHQFDVSKEMDMQEMSSQIASRDMKINQLMGEINNLNVQLDRTRAKELDLSGSASRLSINSQQQQQQLTAFSGHQPQSNAPSFSSIEDQQNRPNVDDNPTNQSNPSNATNNSPSFLQNVLSEMHNLKAIIDLLRGEKRTLESRLEGKRHRSGRRSHHHRTSSGMGTSFSANSAPIPDHNLGHSTGQHEHMESEPSDAQSHHHHGRHRRHHRHHASKALRRLEKQMARSSAPVINSAFMFKGFTTYSNQTK